MNSSQSSKSLVILAVGIVIGAVLALAIIWVYRTNIRPQELQNAVTAPVFPKALPKFKVLPKLRLKNPQTGNPRGSTDPLPIVRPGNPQTGNPRGSTDPDPLVRAN